MSYSNPLTCTYRFPAISVVTDAILGRFIGPKGKTGRIVDVGYVVTTGVTVAASGLEVGTAAAPDAYATLAVPIAAANAVGNGATLVTSGTTGEKELIPADSLVVIGSPGGATAGAVDALVVIDWF